MGIYRNNFIGKPTKCCTSKLNLGSVKNTNRKSRFFKLKRHGKNPCLFCSINRIGKMSFRHDSRQLGVDHHASAIFANDDFLA